MFSVFEYLKEKGTVILTTILIRYALHCTNFRGRKIERPDKTNTVPHIVQLSPEKLKLSDVIGRLQSYLHMLL